MKCPACNFEGTAFLNWEYSGLGDSVFNYTAEFCSCDSCGLSWIANIEDRQLTRFYIEECSYFENNHFDITAPANIEKFKYYRSILSELGEDNKTVTDIGCGRGGFVKWLALNGWGPQCEGVDVDVKSLPQAEEDVSFYEGVVTSLPFENCSRKLLTYFHVLEHIIDSSSLLHEAFRVLADGGVILIEVPDASRYVQTPISDGFWVSIREHIYHFTPASLIALLEREGFSVEFVRQSRLPTPEFTYSSLVIAARKTSNVVPYVVEDSCETKSFIKHSYERIRKRADELIEISKLYPHTVFWGVSNQLLSILPLVENNIESFTLCDASSMKQTLLHRNHPIVAPDSVGTSDSLLIVSSWLHRDSIRKRALELGWDDKRIKNIV